MALAAGLVLAGMPAAHASLLPCATVLAAASTGQTDVCGAQQVSGATLSVYNGSARLDVRCGAASDSTTGGDLTWTPAQDCTMTLTALSDLTVAVATMS